MHAWFFEQIGQRAPAPHHVVVNGWYFYSLNWVGPAAILRQPAADALAPGATPAAPGGHQPVDRAAQLPDRRAGVARGLPPAVSRRGAGGRGSGRDGAGDRAARSDRRAGRAGRGGLRRGSPPWPARRTRWRSTSPGSTGATCAGRWAAATCRCSPASRPQHGQGAHAVASLDWWYPDGRDQDRPRRWPITNGWSTPGTQAEAAAFGALASSPRRLSAFRRLLADAQHLVPVREEQVGELTIAWPVMRRAVVRIGEALVARGLIDEADDVFFLTRDEMLGALTDGRLDAAVDVAERRARRERAGPARAAAPHRSAQPRPEEDVGLLPADARCDAIGLRAGQRITCLGGPSDRIGAGHPRPGRSSTSSSRARSWWRR